MSKEKRRKAKQAKEGRKRWTSDYLTESEIVRIKAFESKIKSERKK